MKKASVRLRLPLIEQLDAYCRSVSVTRMAVFSEAILRLRAGWNADGNVAPHHKSRFRWDRVGNPKQYIEEISPTRLGGQPRKVLGTKLTEVDAEYVDFLAKAIQVNHRQIIEAAVMIFLSAKCVPVIGMAKPPLEKFWESNGQHGQGDELHFLLEKGRGDWTQWSGKPSRPLRYKGITVLIDASVLLLALGQNDLAQLGLKSLLNSAARVLITSAIISEVSVKGYAILSATEEFSVEHVLRRTKAEMIYPDHIASLQERIEALIASIPSINIEPSDYPVAINRVRIRDYNFTRVVSLVAAHRVRRQQVISVVRAVRVPWGNSLGEKIILCMKPIQMFDYEYSQLIGTLPGQ